MNEVVPSLSDIAAVTNAGRNNNGWGGFNDGWWILIILFALWGNNGWGGNNGSAQDVKDGYTLASDFATLERQIDSGFNSVERKGDYIQEQICNSDSTRANQIATVQASLMDGFANTNLGISNNRYENQLATSNAQAAITSAITSLGSDLQSCCCQQRYDSLQNTNTLQSQLADNRYADTMNTNMLNNAINNGFCTSNYNNANNTRDIIDAINTNARATQDMIMANRIEDKDNEIAQLRTMLNNANLAASQAAQTNAIDNKIDALGNRLQPIPVPAFAVPNPFNYNNGCNSCNCGNYNF